MVNIDSQKETVEDSQSLAHGMVEWLLVNLQKQTGLTLRLLQQFATMMKELTTDFGTVLVSIVS